MHWQNRSVDRGPTAAARRLEPPAVSDHQLDDLNRELGAALLRDGRVFAGTTTYAGRVAFRPAIVNWRTQERDVDALVDVLLELLPSHLPG